MLSDPTTMTKESDDNDQLQQQQKLAGAYIETSCNKLWLAVYESPSRSLLALLIIPPPRHNHMHLTDYGVPIPKPYLHLIHWVIPTWSMIIILPYITPSRIYEFMFLCFSYLSHTFNPCNTLTTLTTFEENI